MLRSFLFSLGWIRVQVLIDASFDFVFIWAGFGFRNCSILAPCWIQFGSILEPFWVHFGSIRGPWRGPVEEKLPSRTEDRCGKVAVLHFKRFWAQKGDTRRPKIDQKSMKNRCKNQ